MKCKSCLKSEASYWANHPEGFSGVVCDDCARLCRTTGGKASKIKESGNAELETPKRKEGA